jgi:hypothetical protein
MDKDIDGWKNYMLKKKKGSEKSSLLLPEDWYTDHLLGDMGLQTRRSNRLLEQWFVQGDASKYKTVITQYSPLSGKLRFPLNRGLQMADS